MKPYVLFPLLLLAVTPVLAAPSGDGTRTPPASAASPCDSVSDSPFTGGMIITGVSVEGGGNTATVAANDSFSISLDYYIQVCDTPSKNFCQVVVGYAGSATPQFCIFRERVTCTGQSGTFSFRMKAPAFPTEYIVAFDLGRSVAEPPCPTTWPQGTPVRDRYVACINVSAGNVPVPLTGGVDNVTAAGATLHGTVNPAGSSTAVRFLIGAGPDAYTDSITAFESPVTGSSALSVSGSASGLTGNTRYYYRLSAESVHGYNRGAEATFFTGPQFTLAEQLHDFGHLALNGSRTDSVSVTNTGSMTLQVTSAIPLTGQYAVSPGSATLAPGAVRKFAVTFSPPAYGRFAGGIVFFHGAATSPDTLHLAGDVPIGSVRTGWNIVSVPLTVPDPRKTTVFPAAVSNAFEFSGGYFPRDTLFNGRGYWMKFPGADSMVVGGDVRETETVGVAAGWNMIGGPSLVVPVDSVTTSPPGILSGNFFEYGTGYAVVDHLRPGNGYWVKVSGAGTLTLTGVTGPAASEMPERPAAPEGYAELEVTDAGGSAVRLYVGAPGSGRSLMVPPPPPDGAFDARFEGDLGAASPVTDGRDIALLVSGARYPVTLSWNGGGEGAAIATNAGFFPLGTPGSVRIRGPHERVTLMAEGRGVRAGGMTAQAGFTGSYPNPFNPSTRIDYTIPIDGRVRIAVFNALGEEVALLADGVRPAGGHTVGFNAAGLPGGVYFCRMDAAGRVSTVKLLLLK